MTTSSDLVAAASARVPGLSVAQVADRVEAGDAVVVDVREPGEVEATGRIPGAVTVPRGMLEFRADTEGPMHEPALDPQRPTILYCAGGPRSALAAATLQDMGYADVAYLEGGSGAWADAGRPLEQAPTGP